ncbi:MAG: ABC transporter permease [Legionellales bacterium]
MTFEFLWTDICFLTLLSLGLCLSLYSLRKPPVRQSFTIILHRPIGLSAGVVLLVFLTIGVLDSIHFRSVAAESDNATSLLDKIFYPLGDSYEKTYSAPLAMHLFVSETEVVGTVAKQVYPRLSYPPKSMNTEADKQAFIKKALLLAGGYSVLITACFWLLIALIRLCLGYTPVCVLSRSGGYALVTLGVLVFALLAGFLISRSLHVLGTGQIGQDVFYFSIKSIRTGLIIGTLTTLFMMPLALFLGIVAGYFGGIVDDVIQYIYTTLSSIPGVLLITASVLSLQTYISSHPEQFTTLAQSADARLLALCLILGVTSWTSLCRLLRAETLKLREIDYVQAARALGSSWITIIRKHLLPNVMHIVVITLVLDFSFLVMAEAVLSYVGVGVSPMTISWGNMINGARLELARDPLVWWPMFAAFLLMFLLVLAINLFADAVRDAFDPHQAYV